MNERRKSRQIHVGGVAVGGDAPISVQSMTTTKTDDVGETLIQVHALATQGADIVRVAVPHEADAKALPEIVLEAGVHGLRLNPGNMRNPDHVKQVAEEAKARGVPIRIGVNAGSLNKALVA